MCLRVGFFLFPPQFLPPTHPPPASGWITNSYDFIVTLTLIHVSQSFTTESKARL